MFWFNCIYVYDYYFVDPNGQQLPLAIIQYTFLYGKPLPVKMEPHGNAKSCSHLYIRTQRSTLSELKDNVDKMTPKAAVHVLYDKAGGVTNTNSLSELQWCPLGLVERSGPSEGDWWPPCLYLGGFSSSLPTPPPLPAPSHLPPTHRPLVTLGQN